MTPLPALSEQSLTDRLAALLIDHMKRTGQPAADIARQLGVEAATIRGWMAPAGRDMGGANEFAHLDTAARLGAWLRARIADSGRSVREIADTTESVSMATIYNWLRGEHLPLPPTGEEPDRFDTLLSNPTLDLNLRQRVQLDEVRRRLTGTSLRITPEPAADWPARALPAGNRTFTGRRDERRRLDRLLTRHAQGAAVVISALTGMGGAGKTALAVHWARTHQVRATFTDGCLYINLNGYAESPPLAVDTALRKLLQQLDIDPKRMPADTEALTALYQETLSGRRLLIVLDNAHAEPQVRPLLPADPECLAVITSRNRLQGLDVTDGPVTHVHLDVLTAREAASLLRKLLGGLVTKSTSDADIDVLGKACGYLPLALQIAAANYLTHARPAGVSIREYADSLDGQGLDALAVGPTDPATAVTAVLDNSYRHLSQDARRAYRLLGLHPGPDWTPEATASLVAEPIDRARSMLAELVEANLVSEHRPNRYSFHDLVREHAYQSCRKFAAGDGPDNAVLRLLDHYVHTAHAAALMLSTSRHPIRLGSHRPGATPETFDDYNQASAWLTAECAVLLAALHHAAESGFVEHGWHLAWSIGEFLNRRGHWQDQAAAGHAVLRAALQADDIVASLRAHRQIAQASINLGRLDDAAAHLRRSLGCAISLDDELLQADDHHNLAVVLGRNGHDDEAVEHSRRALGLYRECGSRFGQALALNSVGWLLAKRGDHVDALTFCLEAFEIHEASADVAGMANTADSLGYIHRRLGDFAEAANRYRDAVDLFGEIGDRYPQASSLCALAETCQAFGDDAAARRAWEQALAIYVELEHPEAEHIRALIAGLTSDTD